MLGDCALPELTTKRLQSLVTALSTARMANGKERTRKAIENILLTLSSIVSTARAWGYAIPKVSISELSLPQDRPKKAVLCAARHAAHYPGCRRTTQYDLFSAISDRNCGSEKC